MDIHLCTEQERHQNDSTVTRANTVETMKRELARTWSCANSTRPRPVTPPELSSYYKWSRPAHTTGTGLWTLPGGQPSLWSEGETSCLAGATDLVST